MPLCCEEALSKSSDFGYFLGIYLITTVNVKRSWRFLFSNFLAFSKYLTFHLRNYNDAQILFYFSIYALMPCTQNMKYSMNSALKHLYPHWAWTPLIIHTQSKFLSKVQLMTCFSRIFQLRIHEFCSTKFLINSWHQNHQKFMIYEINFLRHFVYFIFWLDQKQGELLQTAISTIYLLNSLEHASRKINVFHRIIKEIKKINKNKKIKN